MGWTTTIRHRAFVEREGGEGRVVRSGKRPLVSVAAGVVTVEFQDADLSFLDPDRVLILPVEGLVSIESYQVYDEDDEGIVGENAGGVPETRG